MKKNSLNKVLETIKKEFDFDSQTELNYNTDFQLLVAVMLSAQTTDVQVNKVTEKLFKKVQNPCDIIQLGKDELLGYLDSINYYKNKSKYIYKTSKILIEEFDGQVPDNFEDLTKLFGVGNKTAKVVLLEIFDNDKYVPVDTHVHRVANRLGLVDTDSPDKTSRQLEKQMQNYNGGINTHHQLLLFGRYHCKARNPECEACPLQNRCLYYQNKK